jgi:arylsulfatase A-like enzyme
MASLFTAQYPRRHGAGAIINDRTPLGRSRLPAGAWTLTRALHGHSYRTHAIVTNPYLALRYGFGEAFDGYENITVESEAFVSFSQTTIVRALTWFWPQLVIGDRAETVSRRACLWLDGAQRGRPFFLWLHYIDPHAPYSAPGATVNKSMRGDLSLKGSENEEQRALSRFTLTSPDVARLRSGEIRLSTEDKERVRDLYRAEVASVDAAVGRVLDALDRAGLSEHTLLVVVGDHGEEFWEHGGVEHGRTVYEEVVRIPLLLRWPGHLPAGRRVDALARITDVAPTILDLLGMAVPGGRDGETLLPLVRGETSAPRVALIENMLFAEERIGIRTADSKYVLWDNGKEEVYYLSTDPQERVDLAGIDGALAPLREAYARLNSNGKSVASPPSLAPEITSGTAAALSALGYLN